MRSGLVDELVRRREIADPRIEAAFRDVPRHRFLTQIPLAEAYENRAIALKVVDGAMVSSSSQPSMMALMLAQLELAAGDAVLEIGTGSGYNAALLAQVAGERGRVVTVEIDADTACAAGETLAALRVANVTVVEGDGGFGYAPLAPYDRLIVTAAAAGIPAAWVQQLRPGGRLVMPLSLGGASKLVAFVAEREGRLRGRPTTDCAFVGLRGAYDDDRERNLTATALAGVRLIVRDATLDARVALNALQQPPTTRRLDTACDVERLVDGFMLWLALAEPGRFAKLQFDERAAPHALPALWRDRIHGVRFSFGLAERGGVALLDVAKPLPFLGRQSMPILFGYGGAAPVTDLATHFATWVAYGRPSAAALELVAQVAASVGPPSAGAAPPAHATLTATWRTECEQRHS